MKKNKINLIDSPKGSIGARHGFTCAIQINKYKKHYSFNNSMTWASIADACQAYLGKEYRIDLKRPGKKRKWFYHSYTGFGRFFFKNKNERMIILLTMNHIS